MFWPQLQASLSSFAQTFAAIPEERKAVLAEIANYLRSKAQQRAALIFICTHNSRRSQLAQVWAQAAAAYYGVEGVETFSGGTEVTAFYPQAVKALERAGFVVEQANASESGKFLLQMGKAWPAITAFSKRYSDPTNPKRDFCAVMTCSQADGACPVISGASARIALPYEDPKVADGTPVEAATYDERSREIGRDLCYAFSLV